MFNPAEALRAPDLETVPEGYRDAVKEQLAEFVKTEKIDPEILKNLNI